MLRRAKSLAPHSPQKDAQQVQFHYDVSDDFYALWLDPRRVYSCAYYRDAGMSLAQAQEAKLDHICRKLMLKPGERFLDIGAGWGGLLMWAAENYGVNATGITLSKNQHAHVQRLIEDKGLQGRVRMELRDYRELDESQGFDKIASVGMFEHVGQANMPAYFGKIQRLLKPGGLVMNHGITAGSIDPGQLGAGMGDFIEKYIFPGRRAAARQPRAARPGGGRAGDGGHGEPAAALRAHLVGLVGRPGVAAGRGAARARDDRQRRRTPRRCCAPTGSTWPAAR